MRILKPSLTLLGILFFFTQGFAQRIENDSLASKITAILNNQNVPGAGVALVSKDSIIWLGTLGKADVKNNIPVTRNTLFPIGSISKTFLGVATMIAQEKGILNITEPVGQLVPSLDFQNEWNDDQPVRLIHLLEHTSGFDEAHFSIFSRTNSKTPFDKVMTQARKSLETRWKPGNYFEYNTLGYIMSAHILEEKAGIPFENFVANNLLTPLEMDQATYHPQDSLITNLSKGYEGNEYREVPIPDIPQWPAGMLTIRIEDMAHFVQMLMGKGQFKELEILKPKSIDQIEKPETSISAGAGVQYGYGKGIKGNIKKGHLFYGHDGRAGGFLSDFGYNRELDFGYVILINNTDGGKALKAIRTVLLSTLKNNKEITDNQLTALNVDNLKPITGCYQPITSVPQLGQIGYFIYRLIDMPIIEEENGHFYQSSMLGDKKTLIHVRELLFKNTGEPLATSAFVDVKGKGWQWITDEASYQQISTWKGYIQFYTAVVCVLIILLSFIILLIGFPINLIRKNKQNIQLQLFPLLSIGSLLGMGISIIAWYDPLEMYSVGAILFAISGWAFLLFSFTGFIKSLLVSFQEVKVNPWVKYHSLAVAISCSITSCYLLYWGIIGLTLWNY